MQKKTISQKLGTQLLKNFYPNIGPRHAFTSTWLSVSAKGIDLREFLGDYLEPLPSNLRRKPFCQPEVDNTLLTFDHLTGVKMRDKLHLVPILLVSISAEKFSNIFFRELWKQYRTNVFKNICLTKLDKIIGSFCIKESPLIAKLSVILIDVKFCP
jgi:hypothetical protein